MGKRTRVEPLLKTVEREMVGSRGKFGCLCGRHSLQRFSWEGFM